MKVIAFDPFLSPERAIELGVEKVPFEELLRRADFVSLHTPLTDKTRNIIDAAAIARMKRGVDHQLRPRRSPCRGRPGRCPAFGHVAGAALDVFETEPPTGNALIGLDLVVLTPHLGASTSEAQENVAVQIANQLADYLISGAVSNALNMPSISVEEAPPQALHRPCRAARPLPASSPTARSSASPSNITAMSAR